MQACCGPYHATSHKSLRTSILLTQLTPQLQIRFKSPEHTGDIRILRQSPVCLPIRVHFTTALSGRQSTRQAIATCLGFMR